MLLAINARYVNYTNCVVQINIPVHSMINGIFAYTFFVSFRIVACYYRVKPKVEAAIHLMITYCAKLVMLNVYKC